MFVLSNFGLMFKLHQLIKHKSGLVFLSILPDSFKTAVILYCESYIIPATTTTAVTATNRHHCPSGDSQQ